MVMLAAVQRLLEQIGDLLSGLLATVARSVIAYRHLTPDRLRSHPGSSPKPIDADRPRTETAPFTLAIFVGSSGEIGHHVAQAREDAATWGARPSTSSIMRSASRTLRPQCMRHLLNDASGLIRRPGAVQIAPALGFQFRNHLREARQVAFWLCVVAARV